MIQFAGENRVPSPVAGQKHNLARTDAPAKILVGWFAERRRYPAPALPLDAFHLVKPAAANDTDFHGPTRLLMRIRTRIASGYGIWRRRARRFISERFCRRENTSEAKGPRDQGGPDCVTTLRRAGFLLLPRAAACHDNVTDESSVRAPVDAHAVQGRLGRYVHRDLGAPDHGERIGIAEEVIWFPGGLQVRLRGDGIDGAAIRLPGLKGPLIDGGIHLTAIVQDATPLRLLARFDETWDRQGGQQSNNCDDYHYFDQRETLVIPFEIIISHKSLCSPKYDVNYCCSHGYNPAALEMPIAN